MANTQIMAPYELGSFCANYAHLRHLNPKIVETEKDNSTMETGKSFNEGIVYAGKDLQSLLNNPQFMDEIKRTKYVLKNAEEVKYAAHQDIERMDPKSQAKAIEWQKEMMEIEESRLNDIFASSLFRNCRSVDQMLDHDVSQVLPHIFSGDLIYPSRQPKFSENYVIGHNKIWLKIMQETLGSMGSNQHIKLNPLMRDDLIELINKRKPEEIVDIASSNEVTGYIHERMWPIIKRVKTDY